MKISLCIWRVILLYGICVRGFQCLVDVHFENKEGGFFLKHSGSSKQQQQQQQWRVGELDGIASNTGDNSVLSIDRFTVFHNSHPISVRAVYGPFSTKQTVPARYIVPDPPPPPPSSFLTVVVNSSTSNDNLKPDALLDGRHLEVSAHLVNHEISRDSPVLRVLFHIAGIERSVRKYGKQHAVCVVLHVSFADQTPLTTTCSPSLEDGQCLAEVTIPSGWWPPLPNLDQTKPQKSPRRVVQASYYVLEPKNEHPVDEGESYSVENCSPHLQIQPLTKIDAIPLVNARSGYRELKMDDLLFTLVPTVAVYPRSKIYVPVYIRFQLKDNIIGFIIKGRAKSGLRILDAQCRLPDYWNLSFTANPKNTAGTVIVTLKNMPMAVYNHSVEFLATDEKPKIDERVEEVFSWLLEVEYDSTSDVWNEEAHVVWIVHYVTANSSTNSFLSDSSNLSLPIYATAISANEKFPFKVHKKNSDRVKHKITAKFEIHKDITQAVLPVSKTWELINTALLIGKQVSQPMKIFVVSQSGKIADVTRQSTCHTEDDSVLKVTSSCSSVYVDGSEVRGSSNATILVKYETFTGTASFLVWMPEVSELDIVVSDVKLNQIYDWVIPDTQTRSGKIKRSSKMYEKLSESNEKKWNTQKLIKNMNSISTDYSLDSNSMSNSGCKLKYQQATVDVYCRFKAVDHDTGRVSYLINRKTWLKITDLVLRGLRIADPQVASLNGRIVIGRNVGRTEVQVVSPLTGRVIGSKEIRVVNDKVSITKLLVNVVSGLQLNVVPDSSGENIYIAETSITRKLSAQYQEGLLDIEVEFSDRSVNSISDISTTDYSISVDSLSPDVVAFAPMLNSIHPRVIAVGEGKGNLLKVSLLLPESCRIDARMKDFILVSTSAFINVDFYDNEYGQKSPMFVQNDGGIVGGNGFFGGTMKDKKRSDIEQSSDSQDMINGISPSSDVIKEPAVQARQHQSNKNNLYSSVRRHSTSHIAPMEMGMYIILATFSFAIVVFVVSCIVYASKYKPQNVDFQDDNGDLSFLSNGYKLLSNTSVPSKNISQSREPTTTNVHDWVWLGRATLERASGLLVPSIIVNEKMRRKNDNWIRITSNPTYAPEPNPDVDLNADNNALHNQNRVNTADESRIDSTTYNKRSRVDVPFRGNTRQKCFRLLSIPNHSTESDRSIEEYKPPVPPHKNLDVSTISAVNAAVNSENEIPPNLPHRHKHHHHHHNHHNHHHHHHHHHRNKSADATGKANFNTYVINRDEVDNKDNEERLKFVNSSENLSEIKKANIVGNPMFSINKTEEDVNDGCLGIEELNLGMDYKQIMEYFDNLKESTA